MLRLSARAVVGLLNEQRVGEVSWARVIRLDCVEVPLRVRRIERLPDAPAATSARADVCSGWLQLLARTPPSATRPPNKALNSPVVLRARDRWTRRGVATPVVTLNVAARAGNDGHHVLRVEARRRASARRPLRADAMRAGR